MKDVRHNKTLMLAAALLASAPNGVALAEAVRPIQMPKRPPKPDNRTAQQKEIAAWNAAVEQRKAEKKARKGSKQ